MYELKDSYFVIFDMQSMIIGGGALALAIIGFFLFRNKRRKSQGQ